MKRILLMIKRAFGYPVTFGEIAEANGEGPCKRCVGRAVSRPSANIQS